MKKVILMFSAILMMSFIAVSASTGEPAPPAVAAESAHSAELEEALYCSVEIGGVSGSCWLCNCAKLAAEIRNAAEFPNP
jgi:hypothetical protein